MGKVDVFLCIILVVITSLYAQEPVENRAVDISGQWFLTYQKGKLEGANLDYFQITRGHLIIEKELSSSIIGRITPDISLDKEGDGEGDLEMRLKYCYLKLALPNFLFIKNTYVEFGLVHRPWLDFEQHINNYRMQGTMFLERNDIFNSCDYGLTFFGFLGGELSEKYKEGINNKYAGKYGSISIGIHNGGGYHSIEKNVNKTVEGRLSIRSFYKKIPGFQISYTGVYGKGNVIDSPDWVVNALFLSMEHRKFVFTAMYYQGKGNYKGDKVDSNCNSVKQNGYSIFGEYKLEQYNISLIGRYDKFICNEIPDVSNARNIIGMAYLISENIKSLISVDINKFDNSDDRTDSIVDFVFEVKF